MERHHGDMSILFKMFLLILLPEHTSFLAVMSFNSEVIQPISWEAVKALAAVVGVREAARQMGLSEEQVKKRCTREGWLATPEARVANQRAVAMRSGSSAPIPLSPMSPAALIHAELAQLGSKTRLSIARGIAKAGEHIETLPAPEILDRAQDIKSVAQTADLVHGWKDAAPQVKIRLDVLSGSAEAQPIDVEASVTSSWEEDIVDPLDEY
jgi:hypothetical protein